jgi:hypothetical protein
MEIDWHFLVVWILAWGSGCTAYSIWRQPQR